MPRLAFVHRTDTHVSDKSPGSWKGDYPAEVWENLRQVGAFARHYEAQAVLDGGDYFHVKAASRNPHHLVEKTARLHKGYPCETWCVEGNHDMAYNSLDSIPTQPLGVLYGAGVFRHLREEVFDDGRLRVRVVGVPYSPFRTLDDLRAIQKKPGDTFLIAIVHQLAGQQPPPSVEDFFNEPVFRYGDLVTPDGPDVWCFGHWHKDQGIVEVEGKTFVNQGALSRGALIRENLERVPRAALIETTASGLSVVSLPLIVAPPEDVFDLEKKEKADQEEKDIESFVAKLQATLAVDPSAGILTTLGQLDFAAEVRDVAKEYLERARAGVGLGNVPLL